MSSSKTSMAIQLPRLESGVTELPGGYTYYAETMEISQALTNLQKLTTYFRIKFT